MVAWAGPGAASGSGSVPALASSALAVKALASRSLELSLLEKGFSESKKELSAAGSAGRAEAWPARSL